MSETRQDRIKQIKYMIEHKADYLANGTTEQEFNDRLMLLREANYKSNL
jgi:hypothetical protein